MDLEESFGPVLLEGQAEWRDVPAVVRSSILRMAAELQRLHRLLLRNLQVQRPSQPLQHGPTDIQDLQAQMSQLQDQLQSQQDQADARHLRIKQKLSSLWGQVAATAKAAAEVQAEQVAAVHRIEAKWAAADTQLKILRSRTEEQDQRLKRDSRSRTQVDQALHELQKSQELSRWELRRLQKVFDQQVVETTVQVHKVANGPEHSWTFQGDTGQVGEIGRHAAASSLRGGAETAEATEEKEYHDGQGGYGQCVRKLETLCN